MDKYCEGCTEQLREQAFIEVRDNYKQIQNFQYNSDIYSHPKSIVLGLTNRCVHKCTYCFVKQSDLDMDYATAENAIKWLLENNEDNNEKPDAIFFGGEPLLKFDDIIKPLVEKYHTKVKFSITTSGSLLNEDIVDFFYKHQISILLSFDGVPEVQNKQRPLKNKTSFDEVLKNIPYLLLRFPHTTMRSTLTKHSIPYLYDTVMMAVELGFESVTFCPDAYEEWTKEEEKELENQLMKIGLYIYKKLLQNEYPIEVQCLIKTYQDINLEKKDELRFNNAILRCGLGTTSCGIAPNGDIVPCQESTSCSNLSAIGNVNTGGINFNIHQQYLEKYWNKINNITCNLGCSTRQKILCLADLCPSRLEDFDFKITSPKCITLRMLDKITSRLYFLCNHSINPIISKYFKEGKLNDE